MAKQEAKGATLSVMTGSGSPMEAQGKSYKVLPLKIKDNTEFNEDNMNFGSQYFTLNDPERRAKLEKWMKKYLVDSSGDPMTMDKAMNDDWDIVDLKEFLRHLVDISG